MRSVGICVGPLSTAVSGVAFSKNQQTRVLKVFPPPGGPTKSILLPKGHPKDRVSSHSKFLVVSPWTALNR